MRKRKASDFFLEIAKALFTLTVAFATATVVFLVI